MKRDRDGVKGKHVLIFGSDEFRVAERAREVLEAVAPEDPMNLEEVDGQVFLVDQAVAQVEKVREALLTLPFFGGRKVVHFKNVTFTGDSREGRSEAVQGALERLLETLRRCPVGEVQLVVSALAWDRRRTFAKQLEAMAHTERFDLVDLGKRGGEQVVAAEVERALGSMGLTAEPAAVGRLVALVGNETRTLYAEVEKLAVYLHPSNLVTEEAVREIVAWTREMVVWDLCDAAGEGRTREALGLLRQLLAQGENEMGLLAALSNHFRLMACCRVLAEAGELKVSGGDRPNAVMTEKAVELLPKNKKGEPPSPSRVAKLVQQGKRRTGESVFGSLETLYRSYWSVLSGGGDRARALEAGVVELCRLG
ncbi:MAG: DNA polymerase III subunit delta [Verrucomicrobiia bacterium]